MTGRERILKTISREQTDHLACMPITMMFAADLAGVAYLDYVTDYKTLVEAQLRVAEVFGIDHVSCISDPAREAADCGANIQYFENQPPAIVESDALLIDKTRLVRLSIPDPHAGHRMSDRIQAAASLKQRAGNERLIEGWVEGPCAEAADLRGINALMMDFYEDPGFVTDLFEFVLLMESAFAKVQIEAGADIIGIGDAAASLVGKNIYDEFVFPFEKRLVENIHAAGGLVRLHICGNTRAILDGMGRLGCDIVDIDYPVPMKEARTHTGAQQVLCGNIAPVDTLRNGNPAKIKESLAECYVETKPLYIVGAGCEVPRDTPHENMKALVEFARSNVPE